VRPPPFFHGHAHDFSVSLYRAQSRVLGLWKTWRELHRHSFFRFFLPSPCLHTTKRPRCPRVSRSAPCYRNSIGPCFSLLALEHGTVISTCADGALLNSVRPSGSFHLLSPPLLYRFDGSKKMSPTLDLRFLLQRRLGFLPVSYHSPAAHRLRLPNRHPRRLLTISAPDSPFPAALIIVSAGRYFRA